jgi:hypothetical protein
MGAPQSLFNGLMSEMGAPRSLFDAFMSRL